MILQIQIILSLTNFANEYDEVYDKIFQLYNKMNLFNDNYFKSINYSRLQTIHDDLLAYIDARKGMLQAFINQSDIPMTMQCTKPWDPRDSLNINTSIPLTGDNFLFRNLSIIQQIYYQQPSQRLNLNSEFCVAALKSLSDLRGKITQLNQQVFDWIKEEVIMIDKEFNVFKYPGNQYLEVQDQYSVIGKNLFPKLKKILLLYYNPTGNRYSNQMFQVILDELILLLQDKTIIDIYQVNKQEIIQLYNGSVMNFALLSNQQLFMTNNQANAINDDLMLKIKNLFSPNYGDDTLYLLLTNYKSQHLLTYLKVDLTVIFFNYSLPFYQPEQFEERMTPEEYNKLVSFRRQYSTANDFPLKKNIKLLQINNIENASNKLIQFQIKRLVFELMQPYMTRELLQTPITLLTNNYQNELAIYLMQAIFSKKQTGKDEFQGIIALSVRALPLLKSLNKMYLNFDPGQQLFQLGNELQFILEQSPMVFNIFNTMRNTEANLLLQKSELIYAQLKLKNGELLFRLPYYLQQSYSGASLVNIQLNGISLSRTFNNTENISNSNYIFPADTQQLYFISPYGTQEKTNITLPKQKKFVQISTSHVNYGILQFYTDEFFANSSRFQLLSNYDYTKSLVFIFNDCEKYKQITKSEDCLELVDQLITMHINIKYFSIYNRQNQLISTLRYIIQRDLEDALNKLTIKDFSNLTCQNDNTTDYCEKSIVNNQYKIIYPKKIIFHLNLLKYIYQQAILSSKINQETQYCLESMIVDVKICSKLYSQEQEVVVYNSHFTNIDFLGRTKKLDFTLSNATANLRGCDRTIYNRFQMNIQSPPIFTDKYLFLHEAKLFTISKYLTIYQLNEYKIIYDRRNQFPIFLLSKNYMGEDHSINDIFNIFQENNLVGIEYIDYIEFNVLLEILNTNLYSYRDAKYNYSDNNMLDNTRCNGDTWYSFRLLELLYQMRLTNISYSTDGEKFCLLPLINLNLTEATNYTMSFTINQTIFYITKYVSKHIYRLYSPNVSVLILTNKRVSNLCFQTFANLTSYVDNVLSIGIEQIQNVIDELKREDFYYEPPAPSNTSYIIYNKTNYVVKEQYELIQYLVTIVIGLSITLILIRYAYL